MRAQLMVCAVGVALVVTTADREAEASSPSVEIEYMSSMGEYNGHDYVFVEGVMRGTVEREDGSSGEYEVPLIMAYPRSGGNGVGVVDLANTAYYSLYLDEDGQVVMCGRGVPYCDDGGEYEGRRLEEQNIPYGLVNSETFLYRGGYTYIAVQMDKGGLLAPEPPEGTDRRRLSYGTIENSLDAFEIALDATRFVRDPSDFTGNGAPAPSAHDHIMAHGYSQTAFFWRRWLIDGHNDNPDGGIHIDAFLLVAAGGLCPGIDGDGPPYMVPTPCPGAPPTGDALAIAIDSESDPELLAGAFSRDPEGDNPNYRKWEVAGVPHIPATMYDTGFVGATQQNPMEFAPVIRAGFHHLTNWLTDEVEPPPSSHIAGEPDPETGAMATERDADGNALGGIRLPHMVRELDDGTEAGAPVGTYQGVDYSAVPSPDPTTWNVLVALGGTFERFSDERLSELYPTRDAYRERYVAALDAVLEEGYIIQDDYDRYLALADGIQVPERPAPEEPDAGPPGGGEGGGGGGSGGCSMTAASGASTAATVLGLCLIVGAFRLIYNRRRYGHR